MLLRKNTGTSLRRMKMQHILKWNKKWQNRITISQYFSMPFIKPCGITHCWNELQTSTQNTSSCNLTRLQILIHILQKAQHFVPTDNQPPASPKLWVTDCLSIAYIKEVELTRLWYGCFDIPIFPTVLCDWHQKNRKDSTLKTAFVMVCYNCEAPAGNKKTQPGISLLVHRMGYIYTCPLVSLLQLVKRALKLLILESHRNQMGNTPLAVAVIESLLNLH